MLAMHCIEETRSVSVGGILAKRRAAFLKCQTRDTTPFLKLELDFS